MMARRRLLVAAVAVVTACALVPAWAHDPQGVSPGSPNLITRTESRCPTFSWETVPGAELFELVVYQLPGRFDLSSPGILDLAEVEEVLYEQVSGRAASWTPATPQCLEPGGTYVWFVRALLRDGHGESAPTEWSRGRFFSIASVPAGADAEEVVEVLRRYLAAGGSMAELVGGSGPSPTSPRDGPRARSGSTQRDRTTDQGKSMATAKTAIRAGLSDATGEAYGVVGVSASADGAGLGAANTSGGPDLVLDGSADYLPDTELSESGIDRPWGTPQTFNIRNSMGAGMTLQVDGVAALTETSELDANRLTTGTVPSGRIAGSYWEALTFMNPANSFTGSGAGLSDVDAETLLGTPPSAYALKEELAMSGGVDVHWDNLASVPVGFADGIDDDTSPVLPGTGYRIHTSTTVDSTDVVGYWSSITVGADGLPVISYHDSTNQDLKVAHCSDLACSSASLTTVDSDGSVGGHTSITVGADGLPVISYSDMTNEALKVARCSDLACTSATFSTVDGPVSAVYTSITVGADGLPVVSYYDAYNEELKVAHCLDLDCLPATVTTLDSTGNVGQYTSITVGADGLPVIGYYDSTNQDLKVAHCSDLACTSATLSTIDSSGSVGSHTSITVGADGLPLISYHDFVSNQLKVAHCSDLVCSSATLTAIDSGVGVGRFTSITVGVDGLPVISYIDNSNLDLKVARCTNLACTSATVTTVDGAGNLRYETSITIGADGLPVISYHDDTNTNLKVAHCGNRFCLPYARPR